MAFTLSRRRQRGLRFRQARAGLAGFTLIELLTVVAVVGILMTILVPVVGMAQLKAREIKSTANLSSIGKALLVYTQDNHGLLPAPLYAPSNAPAQAQGSANPRKGTWMDELVGGHYLGGTWDASAGIVEEWPETLTCPQFLARKGVLSSKEENRGYGMLIFSHRTEPDDPLYDHRSDYERRLIERLPSHAKNVIVGTSNEVAMGLSLWNERLHIWELAGGGGDVRRFRNHGLYLFLDGSVAALTWDEVKPLVDAREDALEKMAEAARKEKEAQKEKMKQ